MSKLDFIKKLYNGKNCYSDHMNEDELGFLHIPSGVEQLVSDIAQSTPGDLRGDLSINSQAIANTYISLGMGKRYADGVTLIGWRL